MRVFLLRVLFGAATVLLISGLAIAQEPAADTKPTGCLECHSKAKSPDSGAPAETLAKSVHSGVDCDTCHASISMDKIDRNSPHPHGTVEPVKCGECHEDQAEAYQSHGRLKVGSDPDMPKCWSCHGTHDVRASTDVESNTHPHKLPETCLKCHGDVDLVKKHPVLHNVPKDVYRSSVHGHATEMGINIAATCNDCHSTPDESGKTTAHRIHSPTDPQSTTYRFNIPQTCGKCHKPIEDDFWKGIHGQLVKQGQPDAPVCTTCHGEHGIVKPSDPRSPVNPIHVAEQTCSPCHDSAVLNAKYGLPGGRLASYIDSYHGLKSKAGDATVANCASCHGPHLILPSIDPASSINPVNLPNTCGRCHPGITDQLAQVPIHSSKTGGSTLHSSAAEIIRKIYLVLIFGTIGFMLLHNLADWWRRVRLLNREPHVQRLSVGETAQHWVLMISFIVLVLSGFSLRFSESWWVRLIWGWQGGFALRGTVHRVSAVIMVFGAAWHLVYLFTERGRHWFRDMWMSLTDVRQVWQNLLFLLGLRRHEPAYKRFSYMEKAEYWALMWGTVIMTVTGLLLWFDQWASHYLPKGFLEVMLVIHYYEAWLATLAILVWHMYSVMFKPGVYPMNPAWLGGRMPKLMYDHEHADGPKLKVRTSRSRPEEEIEGDSSPPAQGAH